MKNIKTYEQFVKENLYYNSLEESEQIDELFGKKEDLTEERLEELEEKTKELKDKNKEIVDYHCYFSEGSMDKTKRTKDELIKKIKEKKGHGAILMTPLNSDKSKYRLDYEYSASLIQKLAAGTNKARK